MGVSFHPNKLILPKQSIIKYLFFRMLFLPLSLVLPNLLSTLIKHDLSAYMRLFSFFLFRVLYILWTRKFNLFDLLNSTITKDYFHDNESDYDDKSLLLRPYYHDYHHYHHRHHHLLLKHHHTHSLIQYLHHYHYVLEIFLIKGQAILCIYLLK